MNSRNRREPSFIPLTRNKEGKVCLNCSGTSQHADIKALREQVMASNFYLSHILRALKQVTVEGDAIRIRSEN